MSRQSLFLLSLHGAMIVALAATVTACGIKGPLRPPPKSAPSQPTPPSATNPATPPATTSPALPPPNAPTGR